jgi:hypothetical protein
MATYVGVTKRETPGGTLYTNIYDGSKEFKPHDGPMIRNYKGDGTEKEPKKDKKSRR